MKRKLLMFTAGLLTTMIICTFGCKSGHSSASVMDQFKAYTKCKTVCMDNNDRYHDALIACISERLSVEAIRRQLDNCHGNAQCIADINKGVLKYCQDANKRLKEENQTCFTHCEEIFEQGFQQ